MPIKLYLRKRNREDAPPTDVAAPQPASAPKSKKKPKPRKGENDPAKLPFKTTVSDKDLRRGDSPYESDVWKDL